ncbi:MAG TPA: deiodinase family protein [Gemmataceae bacterium]|nr:deiodinase family protein [Gemmataceae bacterium]
MCPAIAGTPKKPAITVADLPKLFDPDKLTDPTVAAAAVKQIDEAYRGHTQPEAVRMLLAILRNQMNGESGWFGPAETRYNYAWLAKRCGADKAIPRSKFPGPDSAFQLLDRNKDGRITANDLDWSDRNPDVQMLALTNRVYRKLNTAGNGRLTKDDLAKFFEQAAKGKDFLSLEDFRDAMMAGQSGGFLPGDAPTLPILVRGLYEGSLGSMSEGPKVEQTAPDFTLKTVDGKKSITLSKVIGKKPVVLVLGNFTCTPFRSLYGAMESMYQRHKEDANFVMVYVREAHPTDGWKMETNTRLGVSEKQPTTLQERNAVAGRFCERLKATMPFVVDDIHDPVGTAYSGMPGRVYIIDTNGKIAYKSGRGPFGFRFGEMEQALAMALLEAK